MRNVRELKQQRNGILQQARGIVEVAEAAGRELSAEERSQFDGLMTQADNMQADIQRYERLGAVNGQDLRSDASIGMSRAEVQQYSLRRAILAAAEHDWRQAGLEQEASRAVAQQLGRDPRGFFVPNDYLTAPMPVAQRAMSAGTAGDGGNLVPSTLDAQSFISMLRNRMVLRQAGATVLTGLVGDVPVPRQTGGATLEWLAEGGAATESSATFDQPKLSPKIAMVYTEYTRKLLQQAALDVEMLVREDQAQAVAIGLDYAGLHGAGGNAPTGVAGTSGIGAVVGGTNGAAPTWEHVVQLETEVSVDNADIGRLGYITNPKVRGKLKVTPRASGGEIMVWGDNAAPLNGYNAMVSNQVRSNLTKGTSSGVCSAIFFGNWADLVIGMWGTLDLVVDPYSQSKKGVIGVVTYQEADVLLRHPQSFAAMLDALTA